MTVVINGEPVQMEQVTVAQLVEQHVGSDSGIALAINGAVVPRSQWSQRLLQDGDTIDILTAVQGG